MPDSAPNRELHRSSLSESDHELLDRLLRNEADMAFRRRTRILFDYMELRDGNRILDCGCGPGFHSMAMRRLRRVDVIGVDIARARLVQAQTRGVPAAFTNGDVVNLRFPLKSFDAQLITEAL
jgi:ubiquinone/menaquinone biosynthesis C-methylase UbiE